MPTLASDLRNKLERTVIDARDVAEVGARAALEALAVHHHEPYSHMKPPQRELRNHLRARARQLGDRQDTSGRLAIDHLAGECAYEHWHRMLFARFLAENNLLIESDDNMAISLAEAEELAKEDGESGGDVWVYASRCAQRMLPQIFRPDDPLLQITFATEHRVKLESLLASLPSAVFTASDALGWVYQFWQSKKKDQVNKSEVKIGADEISAVTQLFTEPYMVEFLLHNTLGAWWAGKRLTTEDTENTETEAELRKKVSLPGVTWDYLRFVRGENGEGGPWRPAAGSFDGWPKAAKDIKVLDPCCGSGHFLVAALHHLVPIRMAEEGLSVAEAVDAVLRDNLHGLEIDERCCQIAAFALAFEAWKMTPSGYRELPELHVACTGIGPQSTKEQWLKLAEQSGIPTAAHELMPIQNGLLNLHRLFSQAPTLGSLINPAELPGDLIAADYETIKPYLTAIRSVEKADDETRERAIAAAGMVKAADLLAGEYSLVITNVPYLGRSKQAEDLKEYCSSVYPNARADLATCLVERCMQFCARGGTTALVTTQYWLFLTTYKRLRQDLLDTSSWNVVARLGPGAFEAISGEVVNVALLALTAKMPDARHEFAGLDISTEATPRKKSEALLQFPFVPISQKSQVGNPNSKIVLQELVDGQPFEEYAIVSEGLHTGDYPRFGRNFWELSHVADGWALQQGGVTTDNFYSGMEHVLFWEDGNGTLIDFVRERLGMETVTQWIKGDQVWGKSGVAVGMMGDMKPSHYEGAVFTHGICAIVPKDRANAAAVRAFCESPDFCIEVRKLDQKVCAARDSVAKVPFDLEHWRAVAEKNYTDGLPEPESHDPTQWLFHGHPGEAEDDVMLQAAVARLLGYRWPAELDDKMRLSKRARALVAKCGELAKFADDDGIVCIPAVRGEEPAAERLLRLLAACDIELESDFDLDDWLRNGFFEEHCKLFHDRPFVWHIWDGRKRDGFHALVNYHKLCGAGAAATSGGGRRLLESLTYAYLGEWITRQRDGVKRGEGGAEDRLAAALELQKRLELILAGEPPHDIFVRWKSLHEQPIGWEPDINDGVRINIRPFLATDLPAGKKGAGILRSKPNIKWTKDRGKEPERPKHEYPWFWNWDERTTDFAGTGKDPDGNRHNDCHYTNKAKQVARDAAAKEGK